MRERRSAKQRHKQMRTSNPPQLPLLFLSIDLCLSRLREALEYFECLATKVFRLCRAGARSKLSSSRQRHFHVLPAAWPRRESVQSQQTRGTPYKQHAPTRSNRQQQAQHNPWSICRSDAAVSRFDNQPRLGRPTLGRPRSTALSRLEACASWVALTSLEGVG